VNSYPERALQIDAHAVVSLALDSGKANGLVSERDIAHLACAMMLLGTNFIDDARFPWARAVIADKLALKSDRLFECASIEQGLNGAPSA